MMFPFLLLQKLDKRCNEVPCSILRVNRVGDGFQVSSDLPIMSLNL